MLPREGETRSPKAGGARGVAVVGRRRKASRPALQRQEKASSWNRGRILLSAETGAGGRLRSLLCFETVKL